MYLLSSFYPFLVYRDVDIVLRACVTQLEGDLFYAPGFASPPNSDFKGYHQYIDETLPPESPYLYGLHPNAEIGKDTEQLAESAPASRHCTLW